jgi:hypothetical protein
MQSGGPGRQERAGGVPRFSAGISCKQPASKKEERSFCAEHEHHWDALALVFGVGNRASQTLTIRAEALWRHSGSCAVNPVSENARYSSSENARYSSSENARYGATVITTNTPPIAIGAAFQKMRVATWQIGPDSPKNRVARAGAK